MCFASGAGKPSDTDEQQNRTLRGGMAVTCGLEPVYRHIDENLGVHLAKIQQFLRQPSISDDGTGIHDCAELLRSYYESLGAQEASIVRTDGHPGVVAWYDAGASKTIVNYCMYDVMPVEGEQWISPPFEANVVNLEGVGRAIVARGAINSKGPYRAWLNALESIIAVNGKLPVNVLFVAEGEEELGSPNFSQVVDSVSDRLKDADAVLNCGASQDLSGNVEMFLGNKGVIDFELRASGKRWGRGPAEYSIHSSNKAIVDSPVWHLVKALSSLTSDDGNRVAVEGFYDDVAPPSEEDLELVSRLEAEFEPAMWAKKYGVSRWMNDMPKRELLENYLFSPTLNITGIGAGYTGPGCKTILPHEALAKFDMRLVRDMKSADMLPKLRKHLDARGFSDVEIRQLSGYEWSRTSHKSEVVQAVLSVYHDYGIKPLIWPTSGGSAPMYLFTREPYMLPLASAGIGHGARAHAPNEYYVVESIGKIAGLAECEKFFVDVLYRFASS